MSATEVPVKVVRLDPRKPSAPPAPSGENGVVDAAEVFRALAPAVLGYLRAQQVNDPEDLLGEVFVHVVRDLHRFRGDAAARRRWVFSIAHNRIVDESRRNRRRPPPVAVDPDVLARMTGAFQAEWPTADPELVNALRQLTPGQRDVVVLRFVADLPVEDVGAIVHRRPGAVKALQRRALARLANMIDP